MITFNYLTPLTLKNRTQLKQFIQNVFKTEGQAFTTLNYVFCTDAYLLTINQQYLNHNYYTDIITFNLANKNNPVLGDIYISVDRVKENAKTENCSFTQEIHRVILHGALHLCGYTDKTTAQQKKMRAAENHYLNLYLGTAL
jgi:probable rRNA maturation factor